MASIPSEYRTSSYAWLKRLAVSLLVMVGICLGEFWLDETTDWPDQVKAINPVFHMVLQRTEDTGGWLVGAGQQVGNWAMNTAPGWVEGIPDQLGEQSQAMQRWASPALNSASDASRFVQDSFFPDQQEQLRQAAVEGQIDQLQAQITQKQQDIAGLNQDIAKLKQQADWLQASKTPFSQAMSPMNPWFGVVPTPGAPTTVIDAPGTGGVVAGNSPASVASAAKGPAGLGSCTCP